MEFDELCSLIEEDFASLDAVREALEERLRSTKKKSLSSLLLQIRSIPEKIGYDSRIEKRFSKAAEIILAKCFQELGLSATVQKQRSNCADVVAKSRLHDYSLVADAKVFRLSRTAKNQKDFKVPSMASWRGDVHDFAVLVCPYFIYPKVTSQIYGQALDGNVCLISWEHLALFLDHNIHESESLSLAPIWNVSQSLAARVTVSEKNKEENFHVLGNQTICKHLSVSPTRLHNKLIQCRTAIVSRAETEVEILENFRKEIRQYTRDEAINKLLHSLRINERIKEIREFVRKLPPEEALR